VPVAYPGIISGGGSTNSTEDKGQRERGSEGSSPLVRGFTQFVNERNPYSDLVVTDVYSTELGIWPSFLKTSEFRGGVGFEHSKPPRGYASGKCYHQSHLGPKKICLK
jgi:hypothetical protein